MKNREFSFSSLFTALVVALVPVLAFGHDAESQNAKKATAESRSAEAVEIAESKAQFAHAERTQSTTRQTGLSAEAQRDINPAEVEKTFGKQVSVVDLSSLTPDQSRALQQTLADRGYYHGRIDGVIGTGTRTAVSQLLARQFALNQRLVRGGRVTEPFLAALGVQANELAPVSGTDAAHVRPQAISPTKESSPVKAKQARPAAKRDARERARKGKAATPNERGNTDSTAPRNTNDSGGSGGTTSPSPNPLSDYSDLPG